MKATLVVRQAQLKLIVLRLKIVALALHGRMLGAGESKLLAKHRRTAVLVDQLLKKFEWSHGLLVVGIKRARVISTDRAEVGDAAGR